MLHSMIPPFLGLVSFVLCWAVLKSLFKAYTHADKMAQATELERLKTFKHEAMLAYASNEIDNVELARIVGAIDDRVFKGIVAPQ